MSATVSIHRHLTLIAAALLAGCAQQPFAQSGKAKTAQAPSICLASYNIDHTEIPNDNTIIFYMKDRSVYKNTLSFTCYGLRMDSRGYTYEPTDPGSDTICSNLVTIHLNTDHNVCQLGEFTLMSKAKS